MSVDDEKEIENKRDMMTETKRNEGTSKGTGKRIVLIAASAIALLAGGIAISQNPEVLMNKDGDGQEMVLEDFEELSQLDVVVVDQGITKQNEELDKFIKMNTGKLGLHLYTDDETNECFGFISGEEGMEPLTVMLYGVVNSGDNKITIGYNFVEASPQFQEDIPTMLIRIDTDKETSVDGRLIMDEEYEHYNDILERYNNETNDTRKDNNEQNEINESDNVNKPIKNESSLEEGPIIIENDEKEEDEKIDKKDDAIE